MSTKKLTSAFRKAEKYLGSFFNFTKVIWKVKIHASSKKKSKKIKGEGEAIVGGENAEAEKVIANRVNQTSSILVNIF